MPPRGEGYELIAELLLRHQCLNPVACLCERLQDIPEVEEAMQRLEVAPGEMVSTSNSIR